MLPMFPVAQKRRRLRERSAAQLIHLRSWNLTLSCFAISSAVDFARPSSVLRPLT
jgi:hypothetical protein